MKPRKWHVVYQKRGDNTVVPWCAFDDERDAIGMIGGKENAVYVVADRVVYIGDADSKAMRLLRDIVSTDFSVAGDRRMCAAIDEARKMLGIDAPRRLQLKT